MCSTFCPPRFFSFSFSLIQSSRSATESQPTQSLMRWSAIYKSNLFIHFRRRHNAQYLCTFRYLRAPADRNVGNGAVSGCNKCVFHLHCLDNSNALAADDPRTLFHQDIEYLAMHGRPYNPTFVLIPSLVEREIAQAHFGLPPMAQHIDGVAIGDGQRVPGRRLAVDGHYRSGAAVGDLGCNNLAFGNDLQS